jgi:enoyl-[acyl-carrier protein] reductase I
MLLQNKRALITGVASNRSIAYGIAEALHQQGASLAFTYQNEKLEKRVTRLAAEFDSTLVLPCDVSSDESIETLFDQLAEHWQTFDILIHSIAYAPADQLAGDYLSCVTREGFLTAHDISSYSFTALAKHAQKYLNPNAALLTMSYLGAERVVQNYNVMGVAKASLEANVRYLANSLGPRKIRVNAVSAGPIKTLAASGVKNLRHMLAHHAQVSPLRENVTSRQVGNAAMFLCSDLASGITGEIVHVDAGFHSIAIGDTSLG